MPKKETTSVLKKVADRFNKNSILFNAIYRILDKFFRYFDDRKTRSFNHLRLIPPQKFRYGGQSSLVEYAYTAGIFSTLIDSFCDNGKKKANLKIFDFGCGTGKFFAACYPFISRGGYYTGVDINKEDIDFCKSYYPPEISKFIQSESQNDLYSPNGKNKYRFDVGNEEIDVVHALSVFTHLNESDANFYMSEISRILRPNGIAILTFFIIDQFYDENILQGSRWVFDRKMKGSEDWFYPHWAEDIPERQIGITEAGMEKLLKGKNLRIEKTFVGHWKSVAGVFSQDILVIRKT